MPGSAQAPAEVLPPAARPSAKQLSRGTLASRQHWRTKRRTTGSLEKQATRVTAEPHGAQSTGPAALVQLLPPPDSRNARSTPSPGSEKE